MKELVLAAIRHPHGLCLLILGLVILHLLGIIPEWNHKPVSATLSVIQPAEAKP